MCTIFIYDFVYRNFLANVFKTNTKIDRFFYIHGLFIVLTVEHLIKTEFNIFAFILVDVNIIMENICR